MAFLLLIGAALLVIALLVSLLVRRDRRRGPVMSPDGLRIEAAAGARWREGRRGSRAGRHMGAVSTAAYLEERDR